MSFLSKKLGRIEELLSRLVELEEERSAHRGRPLTPAQLAQRRNAIQKRYEKPTEATESVEVACQPTLPTVPEVKPPLPLLIGVYVKGWQERYKTKARPEVTKGIGVLTKMLKERSVGEVAELLQVYCQMDDPWFQTKKHDIVTFGESIGKVALAHDKGHERPNGERHWTEIVKEREAKAKANDSRRT